MLHRSCCSPLAEQGSVLLLPARCWQQSPAPAALALKTTKSGARCAQHGRLLLELPLG